MIANSCIARQVSRRLVIRQGDGGGRLSRTGKQNVGFHSLYLHLHYTEDVPHNRNILREGKMAQTIKIPGEDHPITMTANPSRVLVRFRGKTVADTVNALTLREASLPPAQYIPRADINMEFLDANAHTTYCPHKGDASYFDVVDGDVRNRRAAWSYEHPHEAVAEISGRIAFVIGQAVCIEEWEHRDARA